MFLSFFKMCTFSFPVAWRLERGERTEREVISHGLKKHDSLGVPMHLTETCRLTETVC